ncbi:MauE/DoxX family redox-associated membrane protein [Lysinibacillus capsici]|uniref:MauE/DoxX family redox-associated membrane protein n=1 Tax=Lysinibacillus capsici TaxID=2115968 RepID=UPI002FDE93D0
MDFFWIIPSIIISFVLFSSAFSKFFSYNDFIIAIQTLYSPKFISVKTISIMVVGMELILAFSISLNFFAAFAFILTSLLFLLFILLFIKSILKQQEVACNCFGIQRGLTNKKMAILRNVILIGISIIGYFITSYNNFSSSLVEITCILITSALALISLKYLIYFN